MRDGRGSFLDFVEKQDNEAAVAAASIEDVLESDERANAVVRGFLAGIMRQRRSVAAALECVIALGRDVRANCRDMLPALDGRVLGGDPDDEIGPGLAFDEIADLKKGKAVVILSFRVIQCRDLRRPVVDTVADGTLAA